MALFPQFAQRIAAWFRSDGRHFQIVSQLLFLFIGIAWLGWTHQVWSFVLAGLGCLTVQLLFIRYGFAEGHSIKSAMVTTMGLSLLLKANHPALFFFAGALAIAQKFAFRHRGNHLWNPANFGIVVCVLLSNEAWISPGQWGTAPLLLFIICTAGLGVLSRVKRLEVGLVFILTLAVLEYFRTVVYLGWEWQVWLHKLSSGSIWLFAFFMITDPMTTPTARSVRVLWTMVVAALTFWWANFHFVPTAAMWVLFFTTPLVPFINRWVSAAPFQWINPRKSSVTPSNLPMS